METRIDTPFRNLSEFKAQVGIPENMYDKLKALMTAFSNDVLDVYGEAKCLPRIMVKRILQNSFQNALLDDLLIHYEKHEKRCAGQQPPYYGESPARRHTINSDIQGYYRRGLHNG